MWYLHHLRNWGSAGRRYSVLSRRAIWLQYKWKEEGRFLDIDRRIEKTLNIVGEEVWSEIDMGCCIVGIDYPIRRIWFWLWQIQKLLVGAIRGEIETNRRGWRNCMDLILKLRLVQWNWNFSKTVVGQHEWVSEWVHEWVRRGARSTGRDNDPGGLGYMPDSQGSSMAQSQHWDRCFGTPRFSIRRLFPLGTNLGREITNVP